VHISLLQRVKVHTFDQCSVSQVFAIMPRGKQFDVGEKTTIMTLFTDGVAPMPNTNQNCVLISPKVVRRHFQVPPPKSNEKPVFCIS
jgi:hypothetical protein